MSSDLNALRSMLRDRQTKEGALGTYHAVLCLDLEAARELDQARRGGDDDDAGSRLVPPPRATETEEYKALQQRVHDASVRVGFRALSSVRYQGVINEFDDPNGTEVEGFLARLADACYYECKSLDGEPLDVTWGELREGMTYGEWEPISLEVLSLNRRRIDLPFSSKNSKATP